MKLPPVRNCETVAPQDADTPAGTAKLVPVTAPVPISKLPQYLSGAESDEKLYAQFSTLQYFAPNYSHATSASVRRGKSATGLGPMYNRSLVHGIIECCSCAKERAFHSAVPWTKLRVGYATTARKAHIEIERDCDDDPQFVCVAILFPPTHPLHSTVYTGGVHLSDGALSVHVDASTQNRVDFDRSLCGSCGVSSVSEEDREAQGLQRLTQCVECIAARFPVVKAKLQTTRVAKKAVKAGKRKVKVARAAQAEQSEDFDSGSTENADDGVSEGVEQNTVDSDHS